MRRTRSKPPRRRRPCRTRKTALPWRSNATSSAAENEKAARGAGGLSSASSVYGLVAAAPVNSPRRDRGADHRRLILVEARHALAVQLRIGDRPAFLAHARLSEAHVG